MTASLASNSPGPGGDHFVIDLPHLARMTLGDRGLEREVLEIFARQTTLMLERIAAAEPALAAAAAHTLAGSARGIGAWRVAEAAKQVEAAAGQPGGTADIEPVVESLRVAVVEASAAITARLDDILRNR